MQKILATDIRILANVLDVNKEYLINIHLFRVQASNDGISPTTSGIHQDGMDFVCMHYIQSENTHPVVSRLYKSNNGSKIPIETKYMTNFLETLIVHDKELYHYASDVSQLNHESIAFRDMLLVSFQALKTNLPL
jgi:hypothetical protein